MCAKRKKRELSENIAKHDQNKDYETSSDQFDIPNNGF